MASIFAVTRDTIGALDGNGFIATLEPGGKIRTFEAIKGTAALPCTRGLWHVLP
ncbi:MAG: hypothetical protein GY809_12345 [Planctomycetes bacterium]|nr:hypothetical protein [Planctomycetota bacterium]